MRTKLFILLILNLYAIIGKCNNVKIFGIAPEYSNSSIILYKYTERITYFRDTILELSFDNNGKFEAELSIDKTTYIFGEFGIYHAYFYAEPNNSYELIFPEYIDKMDKDIFNPFFSPVKIHMGIKDLKKQDLNYLIMDFDYYYTKYHDLKLEDLHINGLKTDIDTFINEINQRYKDVDNQYFKDYKRYRIAYLKNIVTKRKYEAFLVKTYFTKFPILYDNPAYMDLFNNIYSDYFDNYLVSENGIFLYAVINYGHSITRLKKLMYTNEELRSKPLCEYVILKGLNDAFSNQNFSWYPLLLTVDSLHLSTEYPQHRTIAQNIADKALSLSKGTIAPKFQLTNKNEKVKKLSDYKGKYVYLCFANSRTHTSQKDFKLIEKLHNKYNKICHFITILTDDDTEKAKEFISKNNYKWEFLFTKINSPVIYSYDISSYPTYFLIDGHGNFVYSPAPSPGENFEMILFRLTNKK